MNALMHLKTVPTLVITVEGSTARQHQFRQRALDTVGNAFMFQAAPIVNLREEAFAWRDMVVDTCLTKDCQGMFSNVKVFQAKDKTLEREAKQHEYAATYSLYRSIIEALKYGIEQGWEWFMICEDDAVPRTDVLSALPAPPEDAELIVWGGAIQMGAHNHDDKLYSEGKQSKYVRIKNPRNRYIATAYEMSRHAAMMHLAMLIDHPHAVDCSWWYTMDSVVSYAISPTAFVQVGESDRIVKLKNGRYMR